MGGRRVRARHALHVRHLAVQWSTLLALQRGHSLPSAHLAVRHLAGREADDEVARREVPVRQVLAVAVLEALRARECTCAYVRG